MYTHCCLSNIWKYMCMRNIKVEILVSTKTITICVTIYRNASHSPLAGNTRWQKVPLARDKLDHPRVGAQRVPWQRVEFVGVSFFNRIKKTASTSISWKKPCNFEDNFTLQSSIFMCIKNMKKYPISFNLNMKTEKNIWISHVILFVIHFSHTS